MTDAVETLATSTEARVDSLSERLDGGLAEVTKRIEEEGGRVLRAVRGLEQELAAVRKAPDPEQDDLPPAKRERDSREQRAAPQPAEDLVPGEAEEELRRLRNQIRRENPDLAPWENICMLRPIVEEALRAAAEGKLPTRSEWKQLPSVRDKFQEDEQQRKRDEQLDRYGDEMMGIYERVKPPGAHSDQALAWGVVSEDSDDVPF